MTGRVLVVACVLIALLGTACQPPEGAEVGRQAPSFSAPDLDGREVSLAQYRGDVVLLNIWATWCTPCRAEMPAFERIHQEQERSGLRVVATSIDASGNRSEIDDFLERYGITFQVLHDPDGHVARAYESAGVPETFLIGRDGRLLRRWTGRIDPLSPSIRGQIDAALSAGAS